MIDIRTDTPRPKDRFLFDSNLWAWTHYLNSGTSVTGQGVPQVADYLPYVDQVRVAGATRCRVGFSWAELAHLIERNEREGYTFVAGSMAPKDYRHNVPSERARVMRVIERVWSCVKADSVPLTLTLDDACTDAALTRLGVAPVDGYDVFLLEAMAASGVTQLLTDDGDFCCVAGVEVFTANPRVLGAARAQGRLVVR